MGKLLTFFSIYGAMLIAMLQGVVTAALLTRTLSVAEFGVWTQFRIISTLLMTTLSLNLGYGYLRFASSASPDERRVLLHTVISVQSLLCLLITGAALPFYEILGEFLLGSTNPWLFGGMGAFAILTLWQVQGTNTLIIQRRATLGYSLTAGYRAAMILGILAAVSLGGGLGAVIIVLLTGATLMTIIQGWLIRTELHGFHLSWTALKPILTFCLPLFPVQVALWVCASSDRIVLKNFHGIEAVSRYALVYAFAGMVHVVFSAVSSVFLSTLVRWYDKNEFQRVGDNFSLALRIYWVTGWGMAIGLFVGSHGVVATLGTPEYLFKDLHWVALWIGMGSFLFGLYQLFSKLFDLEKRSRTIGLIWTAAMILNIAFNLLLIPSLGASGAAIATLLSYLITFAIALLLRPQHIPLNTRLFKISQHLFAGILIIASILLWGPPEGRWEALLIGGLCGFGLIGLGFVIGVVKPTEIRAALSTR